MTGGRILTYVKEKADYLTILAFILLSLPLLVNHEPWRDEAQAWLIARDSPNLSSLIHQLGYEGTPPLWYIILYPLAKSGLPYPSMTVVHHLIMLTAVSVFILHAPFTRLQKTLFVFGYYILYEYNVIARSYSLSVLFMFLMASVYKSRLEKPLRYSLLIALLGSTNTHSLIIAIAFSMLYVFELIIEKKTSKAGTTAPLFVLVSGLFISMLVLLPPEDLSIKYSKWNTGWSLKYIASISVFFNNAFFPACQIKTRFWNHSLLRYLKDYIPFLFIIGLILLLSSTRRCSKSIYPRGVLLLAGLLTILSLKYPRVSLGAAFFLISLAYLIKQPRMLLTYTLSTTGLLLIFLLKKVGQHRHQGLIFMVFIVALWITRNSGGRSQPKNQTTTPFSPNTMEKILVVLLLLQAAASAVPFYYEIKNDFSAGWRTAGFLMENGFTDNRTLVATYRSPPASSVLPYLPQTYPGFYSLEYEGFYSYITWNRKYSLNSNLLAEDVVGRMDDAVSHNNYDTVLLILNHYQYPVLEADKEFREKFSLMAYFNNTIVRDESLYVYHLQKH
jgi:hypothetical protein